MDDFLEMQAIIELMQVKPLIKNIVDLTNSIKQTDDKEAIEIYINQLQNTFDLMPKNWPIPYKTVKEAIRQGHGDFASIQEKCIKLGLV